MNTTQFQQFLETLSDKNTLQLTLNDNMLTDEQFAIFCQTLADNQHLKTLNVTNYLLNDNAAQHLSQALSHNNTLNELYCCNVVPDEHAFRHVIQAFSANTSITRLTFTLAQLRNHDAVTLAQALESNTSLQNISLLNNPLTSACDTDIARSLALNTSLLSIEIAGQFEQTRRQMILNQRIKGVLESHFYYSLACRNQILRLLHQKLSHIPSLINDILKKQMTLNNPSLLEMVAAKTSDMIKHNQFSIDTLVNIIPEELHSPLATAHFDCDLVHLPAKRLGLFNATAQALRQQQKGEAVSKEDVFHFKIFSK